MKKFIIVIICLFCICSVAQAETWNDKAINIIIDIGENIDDPDYTNKCLIALREAICEEVKLIDNIEKKRELSSLIVTNVSIGITEQDITRLNEVLLILQITYNQYRTTNNIKLIK